MINLDLLEIDSKKGTIDTSKLVAEKKEQRYIAPTYSPTEGRHDIDVSKFSDYIPEGVFDSAALEKTRARRQSSLVKAGSMVARGVVKAALNTVEPFGHILDFEEYYNAINGYERDYSNWFNDFITKTKEDVAEALPIYTEKEQPDIFTSDWFFKNFDEAIASIGYFVPGSVLSKGLGLAIKGIGAATNLTKIIPKAVQGTASIGGPVGAAIAQNYSEHVLSAVQTLEQNTKKYIDSGMSPEKAKKLASQDAEQLIEDGKWNLLLQIPEYLMLFRGSKWTRSFSKEAATASIGKKALGITGVAGMEYLEEANTGFFEKEAARSADVKTGKIKEGDDETKSNRYFDHLASYEGLTEGLIGAFGGAGMKTVSNILDSRNKTVARNQVRENEAFAGNLENFKNINTQSFYDLAQKNAQTGTYESFLETLNIFANTTQEQASQLGFDKDYKTKASQYIKDAEFFEDEYNKLKDSYTKNPVFAQELLYQKINERLATQQIFDISTKISQVQGEISSLRNAEKIGFDLSKLKDNILEFQGLDKELKNAIKERNELSDKPKEQRTVTYNETLGELDSRITLLTEKQSEVSSDIEKQTKEYLKNNIDKKIEDVQKFLNDLSTKEFELVAYQQFKESALSRVKNARKTYNELTSTKPEDLDKIEKELIAKQIKVEKETEETQTTEVPSTTVSTGEVKELLDIESKKADIERRRQESLSELLLEDKDENIVDDAELAALTPSSTPSSTPAQEDPPPATTTPTAQTAVSEDNTSINTQVYPEDSAKALTAFKSNNGKDDGSKPSSERFFRYTEKSDVKNIKFQIVTKTNNPEFYDEILDDQKSEKDSNSLNPKQFEEKYKKENNKEYQGVYLLLVDGTNKSVLVDGKLLHSTMSRVSKAIREELLLSNEAVDEALRFRDKILQEKGQIYVNIIGKSKGIPEFEKTDKDGNRQSFSVTDRIGKLEDISLELPTVEIADKPNKAKLKNGQIGLTGKLYASNKDGHTINLIPRLLNSEEQERVFNLILQRFELAPKSSENPSQELNKIIYFNIPKSGAKEFTLGIDKGLLVIGTESVNIVTPEAQQKLKDFLKTKRINVNAKYGFEDKFTDVFGTPFNTYKEYLLDNNGKPLFGTDLVSNKVVQYRNQYFTYDPSIKVKPITETTKLAKKEFKKKDTTELNRLKTLETNTGVPIPDSEREWFKTTFPNVPIELIHGLIENKSFGRFLSSGNVLLSDQATAGTIYHEAFHTVTQLYLTPKEISNAYREVKEQGLAKTDLEAEELLAEDFIKYKKTGKVLNNRPARNNIFKRLLNFLKDLLNIEASSIEDIYRRLDKGYYKNKPIVGVRQFAKLDRSKLSETKDVTFEKDVLDSIGALFYNKIFSKGLTPNQANTNLGYKTHNDVYNEIIDAYKAEENLKKANNLEYILNNWEDILSLFLEKSKSAGIKITINTEVEEADTENVTKDNAFQEANTISTKSQMNDGVWALITSLQAIDRNGNFILSEYTGLPLTVNPSTTYNFLLKQLAGLSTYEEIHDKLKELEKSRPELEELTYKLGSPSSVNTKEQQLFQAQFTQDFAKNKATSYITLMDSEGSVYAKDATAESNQGRILDKWKNNLIDKVTQTDDNKILLDLDSVQFDEAETFLRSIGLYLSPETIAQSKLEDNFQSAVTAIQNYIKQNKGDITSLFDPTAEEIEKKTDVIGRIKYLTELEADYNPEAAELSFISATNKTVYSIGNNNALSTMINKINNAQNTADLFEQLPHLQTVSTEGSIWLSELFDDKGNKRKDRKILLGLHDGVAAETDSGDFKKATANLTEGDKWVQEINSVLEGRSSIIRTSDKATEHSIQINKFGKTQKLYIPIEDLVTLDNQKLKSTFQDYFKSELKRIALFRVLDIGKDIDIFNKTGEKFTVFDGIIKDKKPIYTAIDKLKDENLSEEELLKRTEELAESLYSQLDTDIVSFFTVYAKEVKETLNELNIKKSQGISKDFKEPVDQLINAFIVNDYINSIEQIKLFIGDMGFYKDLFKRTSGFSGTKQSASNGKSINEWLNKNFERKDKKVETGSINVIVFEDSTQSLEQEVLNQYIQALVDSGITKEQADVILSAYKKMDEGDAQGWITLDEYRSLKFRLGQSIPDETFKRAQNGELLSTEEMYHFTGVKTQYAGPQKHSHLYVPAYHKYSLLPLLPSMVKGKNLEVILNNMTKNQIGYALFKSGSKTGTLLNKEGKANKFYTDTNNGTINTENWQKQVISYGFFGLQQKDSIPEEKVIFGTQFRKLLFSNLFEDGKPLNKRNKELLKQYNSLIDDLVQEEKNNLIKELGINPTTYLSEGKEGIENLLKLLQNEAKDRDLADNLRDGLQSELVDGKLLLKYKFDAMVTKAKIDSMLMSLVEARLIRQKIHGDQLIQVASSGFENKGNRKAGTNDALLGYRQDKEDNTLAAQVMIPISSKNPSHKLLLDEHGSLEKLNKAIKDGKVDIEELQLIAYRIPTQGLNSMEFFEIVEFLPEESSTSIVVPTSIVAKSGSDFDIDKLNVIKPNSKILKLTSAQSKQNKIMGIAKEILSMKENFANLITPNSSKLLTDIVDEIRFIEHLNVKPDADLIRDKFDTQETYQEAYNKKKERYLAERKQTLENNIRYSNQLKLSGKDGKIAQFIKFLTAKTMIGIPAHQNTQHILAQAGGLTIDSKQVTINLPHNKLENGDISISKLKDVDDKNLISEVISQNITATVDAAKDPFLFDINFTLETFNTVMFLSRIGVPFNTIGYFMAQPIIKEYLDAKAINDAGFLEVTDNSVFAKQLIAKVQLKYGKQSKNYKTKTLTESELKDYLFKDKQTSQEFKDTQLQVLDNYLSYKEYSGELFNAARATNMDTSGIGKNLSAVQSKLKLIEEVKNKGFVKGIENVLENSIIKTFNQLEFTQKAFGQFYYTQIPEMIKVKQDLLTKLKPFGEEAIDKLATTIENDLIAYITQNNAYPNITVYKDALFKSKPTAKKLLDLKNKENKTEEEKKLANNLLIKQLQPLLGKKKGDLNSIKIYTKRYDTFTANQLTEAFREIELLDPALAIELMDIGIIQSGLNNSPITYLGLIPFEYYNDLVKTAFEKFNKKNGVTQTEELNEFKLKFIENNPKGKPKKGWIFGKNYASSPTTRDLPSEVETEELPEKFIQETEVKSVDISKSTKKSPFFEKDKTKFAKANKLISRGSAQSSSEAYRIATEKQANVGSYEPSDIIGISAEGNRTNRIKADFKEIQKAMDANVTFVTDKKTDRLRDYNIGEREVAEFLTTKGYKEVEDGVWKKEPTEPQQEIQYEEFRLKINEEWHSTKESAEQARKSVEKLNLFKNISIPQIGNKWKVYIPVQENIQLSKGEKTEQGEPYITETESTTDILNKIVNNSVIKELSDLAQEILTIQDKNKTLKVRILFDFSKESIEKENIKFTNEFKDSEGFWSSTTNTIYLSQETVNGNKNVFERVFLHEIIHSYINYPFFKDESKLTPNEREFINAINESLDVLPKEIKEIGNLEFMSEIMTRPSFVEKIKTIDNGTWFEQFINKILKFFRIKTKTTGEKVVKKTKSIIQNYLKNLDKVTPSDNLTREIRFSKKPITEEEKKILSESPFQAQYVFFKRRLAELAKRQQGLKEGTPQFNVIQHEIDAINEKFIKANEEQSQELYKELGEQTLTKIDEHIATLTAGERLTDRNIEFVADVLDTFREFQGLKDRVGELEELLEPVIQEFVRSQIQQNATEKEAITQEKIDAQTEDIGKFTKGVGSLSDLANYIGRTIGSVIKAAQNRISTRNKQTTKVVQEEVDLLNTWSKKNGVTLERAYNIFIQPKKGSTGLTLQYYESGNENPNWNRIQNTPELKRFYDFYQKTIETSQENLPLKLGRNFIPNIKKSTISNKLKSLVPVHKTETAGFVGNEDLFADVLPTEYAKKISEAEKSRDLGASLLQFVAYAINYEEMSNILPTVRILQRGLTKKLNSKGKVIQREFTKSSDPSKKLTGEQSNIYKMVDDYINMQVFGEMKFSEGKIKIGNLYDEDGKPIGEKYILSSDIIDVALKYNSLLRIGFSPITAGANWLFGDTANMIEAVGGRFFTVGGLQQASNIFMKQNFNKKDSEGKEIVSVMNHLLEELNPLQELDDYDFINRVSLKSKMSTEKVQEYAYSMQKTGEKWLQSRTMLAVMIKDGYLTSSGKLTEKYTKAGEQEKQQLTDKVQRLNQLIHGRYSAREAATLQQSIIYRLLVQFKKWIPSAIEARLMQKQYDNRLQVDVEGRYRTFAKLIINLGDTIKRFKSGKLTELEVYNSKKMAIEITLMVATILGMMALGGDDDESKKLRKHWAIKTGMTLLNRVSGDLSYFYSPAQIAQTSKNPISLIRTFDDLRLAISYVPVAFDTKEGVYKTGSRKGQSKILNKLGNITIGVKPIQDLRRMFNKYELEELR